jgi:hypothetical protein
MRGKMGGILKRLADERRFSQPVHLAQEEKRMPPMSIVFPAIDQLKPDPANPRRHSKIPVGGRLHGMVG